jgi:predicted metalloprotease with PDZ domain
MSDTRPPIRYRIAPRHPEAHLFEASVTVDRPDPAGQTFTLPAWIPGSYMIREFARHVVRISARCGRRPIALEKIDKHTWRAASCDGPLNVVCEIYAWDLSVRGAHLDTTHGFFNGPCVFLRVEGQEDSPCAVEILPPSGAAYRRWRVATAMAEAGARRHGFGTYRASSYDELIDHPVEMGEFALTGFSTRGVDHEVAITGRHAADLERLARDLERVTAQHIDFFGTRAPMRRYVFLVTAVGEGYGGLEHRASTALLCSRDDLPRRGVARQDDRYRTFLGLASHEYFHTWNVKRIKPAAFSPYDLGRENYTRLLWAFEGITSYYDDLALVRCGLLTAPQYLSALARTMTAVERGSGRTKQSVAESSFDAWIKYYRQDENAPNAIVSYYAKGSLVALALDLTIRRASNGRKSLDDVMRALWQEFGRTGRGVGEADIEPLAERISGVRLGRFFRSAVHSCDELELAPLLQAFGIKVVRRAAESASDRGGNPARQRDDGAPRAVLGARTEAIGTDVRLAQVFDGGCAQAGGLSAGDVLLAFDGIRVTPGNVERLLERRRPGERVRVHAFRRDELIERDLRLLPAPQDTYALTIDDHAAPARKRLRDAWLAPARGGSGNRRTRHAKAHDA